MTTLLHEGKNERPSGQWVRITESVGIFSSVENENMARTLDALRLRVSPTQELCFFVNQPLQGTENGTQNTNLAPRIYFHTVQAPMPLDPGFHISQFPAELFKYGVLAELPTPQTVAQIINAIKMDKPASSLALFRTAERFIEILRPD